MTSESPLLVTIPLDFPPQRGFPEGFIEELMDQLSFKIRSHLLQCLYWARRFHPLRCRAATQEEIDKDTEGYEGDSVELWGLKEDVFYNITKLIPNSPCYIAGNPSRENDHANYFVYDLVLAGLVPNVTHMKVIPRFEVVEQIDVEGRENLLKKRGIHLTPQQNHNNVITSKDDNDIENPEDLLVRTMIQTSTTTTLPNPADFIESQNSHISDEPNLLLESKNSETCENSENSDCYEVQPKPRSAEDFDEFCAVIESMQFLTHLTIKLLYPSVKGNKDNNDNKKPLVPFSRIFTPNLTLSHLTELDLANNQLGSNDSYFLFNLMSFPELKRLSIGGNDFSGGVGFESIFNAMPKLISLDLHRCTMNQQTIDQLIKSPILTQLEILDLATRSLKGEELLSLLKCQYFLDNKVMSKFVISGIDLSPPSSSPLPPAALSSLSSPYMQMICDGCPQFTTLKTLTMMQCGLNDLSIKMLAQSRYLKQLEGLHITLNRLTDHSLIAISLSPNFINLKHLLYDFNRVTRAGFRTLAESPYLKNLTMNALKASHNLSTNTILLLQSPNCQNYEFFMLFSQGISAECITVIGTTPHLANLKTLYLTIPSTRQFVSLEKEHINSFQTIFQSQYLSNLTSLTLNGCELDDDCFEVLAQSPVMKNLTSLKCYGSTVTDEGLRSLAQSPYITQLTTLEMTGNITNTGLRYLANSPNMMNLKRIDVSTETQQFVDEVDDDDDDDNGQLGIRRNGLTLDSAILTSSPYICADAYSSCLGEDEDDDE